MRGRRTARENAFRQFHIAAAIGFWWAVSQVIMPILPLGIFAAWVGNGVVFGVYAGMMYQLRGGYGNTLRTILVILIGCTHGAWVLVTGDAFDTFAKAWGLRPSGMWVSTALVLGVLVTLLSGRWWLIGPPVMSALIIVGLHSLNLGFIDIFLFGLMIAIVHFGLLASLYIDTRLFLNQRWPLHGCTACGYDLRNLATSTCPECGRSPEGAAAHP